MMADKELLNLIDVGKEYLMEGGKVTALQNIDLKIEKGDFIAVMGASGSGKSTLMHILGCLDKPTTGHYYVNGRDVGNLTDEELSLFRACKIGFVFQAFNLIPQLTVYENVQLPFLYQSPIPSSKNSFKELLMEYLSGKRSQKYFSEVEHKIVNAIETVGLSHRLKHNPRELSGGEIQRVAIARALAIDPLLILADEPTGNLDSLTGMRILDLFESLHQLGKTIVMVTHDQKVGDRCKIKVHMRDGQIIQ